MERPKILVTGAGGQLGQEFRFLENLYPAFEFMFATKLDLDVTVESWVHEYISAHKPDAVINCAAYTNVERAEDEPENATLGNSSAPGFIAAACHENNALVVHISTDYVFNGESKKPYLESDEVDPLNSYGLSKLEGERAVEEKTKRYYTIRTSWLYSTYGHNFFKTMLRLAAEKGELNVVNDQVASPTYCGDLANDIMNLLRLVLIETRAIPYGLYHYSQDGEASWFDFASAIVKESGMNVPVKPVHSGTFPVKAIRPVYSKLGNELWKKNTSILPLTWQEGLRNCLERRKQGS